MPRCPPVLLWVSGRCPWAASTSVIRNEPHYHSTPQVPILASNAPTPAEAVLKYKYDFKDFRMSLRKQEDKN